jgi:hypothetical protein
MKKWQPSRLHYLLGNQVEWTDALWDEALAFCERNTATPQVMCMAAVLPEQQERIFFKIDYLRPVPGLPATDDAVRLRLPTAVLQVSPSQLRRQPAQGTR